jgi:hypothetical protein
LNDSRLSCLESYAPLLDPINFLAIIHVDFDALAVVKECHAPTG